MKKKHDEVPVQSGTMAASILKTDQNVDVTPQMIADISMQKQEWSQAVTHITTKDNTIKQQQDEIDRLNTLVKGNAIAQHTVSMDKKRGFEDLNVQDNGGLAQRVRANPTVGHASEEDGFFLDSSGKVCASAGICPVAAKAAAGQINYRDWTKQVQEIWKQRMQNQCQRLRKIHLPSDVMAQGVVEASGLLATQQQQNQTPFNINDVASYIHSATLKSHANSPNNPFSSQYNSHAETGMGPGLADYNPKLFSEMLDYSKQLKSMDANNPVTTMLHNEYYEIVEKHRRSM